MVGFANMNDLKSLWQQRYPDAFCWSFGDSPALADELVALVIAGKNAAPAALLPAIVRRTRPSPLAPTTLCSTEPANRPASSVLWSSESFALMR